MMRKTTLAWIVIILTMTALPSLAAEPIRAMLITGGCCHDYEAQKKIIADAVSARANVTWTIVHEGGSGKDHKVSVYQKPDWAAGYDVIVHNECFGAVDDPAFIEAIAAAHKKGVAGVALHCSMHSYRAAKNADVWRSFLGVTSTNHGPKAKITVNVQQADHPVMKGFPAGWVSPNGELYNVTKVWDTATSLAQGVREQGDKAPQTCIWVNQYGPARVFGTTLGHHNETMNTPEWQDLVTRGLLWSVGKLTDEGKPAEGYGPTK